MLRTVQCLYQDTRCWRITRRERIDTLIDGQITRVEGRVPGLPRDKGTARQPPASRLPALGRLQFSVHPVTDPRGPLPPSSPPYPLPSSLAWMECEGVKKRRRRRWSGPPPRRGCHVPAGGDCWPSPHRGARHVTATGVTTFRIFSDNIQFCCDVLRPMSMTAESSCIRKRQYYEAISE